MVEYAFLTKQEFRIDVEAKTPKQGFKLAIEKSKHLKDPLTKEYLTVIPMYLTYRNGMADLYAWKTLKH